MSKILIVDDDVFITRMYERIFRLRNHEVVIVNEGDKTLEILESMSPPPDLIALDVMMPKINGLDLLTKIRSYDKYKDIPVVILTNSYGKEHEKEFKDLKISSYLVKMENTPAEVVQKLEDVIKTRN